MPQVKVIFGSDQVRNFFNGMNKDDELSGGLFEYSFETEAETNAFLLGIEQAMGWLDYYVLEENEDIKGSSEVV